MSAAVLLIIFNRPGTTGLVMEAIRAARPERFYIFGDGPRDHNGERDRNDVRLCEEAREIATAIDWPCKVQVNFVEDNLGCRHGPITAINWLFDNEPEGIILEDDCIPSPSFFPYCGEMLERYRNDTRIMAVCADNFQKHMEWCEHSYYFSRWFHSWGWATWARAWQLLDEDLKLYPEWLRRDGFKSISRLPGFADRWRSNLEKYSGDAWDYLWAFSLFANSGLAITPRVNLVSNIGFGPGGTHCSGPNYWLSNRPRFDLEFPLIHPGVMNPNAAADDYVSVHVHGVSSS